MGLTESGALGRAASGEALASSGTDFRCFRSCNNMIHSSSAFGLPDRSPC